MNGNVSLHTGFITAIHYPTDTGYEGGKVILYDITAQVSLPGGGSTWMPFFNARWGASTAGSQQDFSRTRLSVPKGWKPGNPFTPEMQAQSSRVAFICENGRSQSAVIVGLLEHPSLFDDSKEWGHYSASSFNGVNTLIDKDGAWSVTFTGAILDPVTNAPTTPKVPLAGQIKGPDFSKAYTTMSLPSVPGFKVPPMPSIPALPALPANPVSLPKLPSFPSVPMPGVPAMPGLPSLPGAPPVPSLPSLPGAPAVPGNLPTPPLPGAPTVPAVNSEAAAAEAAAKAAAIAGGATALEADFAGKQAAVAAVAVDDLPTGPTTIMIDKKGSILLDNTNGEVIQLNKPERALQIQARSMVTMVTDKDSFTYVPNGKVTFLSGKTVTLNAPRVCIGSDTATEPMVLGNKLAKAYLDLLNAFLQTPVIGQLGNMPVMISPTLVNKLIQLVQYGVPYASPFLSKKGFLDPNIG
jgi:hypothetical protein